MIERGEGEMVSLSIILLTTTVHWFLPAIPVSWRPNVLGCYISSSHYKQSQFNISHLFAHIVFSIWPIFRIISGVTTPGRSGPGSNANEGVLHIPQISKAGPSLWDGLMSYPRHSLGCVTPSQWYSRCIRQSQPTELRWHWIIQEGWYAI